MVWPGPPGPAECYSVCALDGSVEVLCILLVTTNRAPDVARGWLTWVCVWKGIAPQIEFVFCEENTAFLGILFGTAVITPLPPPKA